MTLRLFRALCLEGASSCYFDLYACRTFVKTIENEKNHLGKVQSVSTDHILEKKYATQGINILFKVTSFRIWSWKPQRTSRCSYAKTWCQTQDALCSDRYKTIRGCCGSVEQLGSSFSMNRKLSSLIIDLRCFDLPMKCTQLSPAAHRDVDRCRQVWLKLTGFKRT